MQPYKRKANIDSGQTLMLFGYLLGHTALVSHYRELSKRGWKFYVVDQVRGRTYYRGKIITIPMFAAKSENPTYKTWYVAHEMAHAYAGHEAQHGETFMMWLRIVCPHDCIHHELHYKPGNAAAAGITKDGVIH